MPVATRAMIMDHTKDPAVELREKVGPFLDGLRINGRDFLVAVYERPEKTRGGLYLPDKAREEDRYQGKVGLVMKAGPNVADGADRFENAEIPQVGEWVVFNIGDAFSFTLGDNAVKLIDVNMVRAVIDRPDILL